MTKRNVRRVHIQSGATDRMHRPLDGVFEVLMDEDKIIDQMERAYNNSTRESWRGATGVRFVRMAKAQADYFVEQERKTAERKP